MDWQCDPRQLDPDIGAAADRINQKLSGKELVDAIKAIPMEEQRRIMMAGKQEQMLCKTPALSDSKDRVLRASEIVPNTWEALVGRLNAGERRELFGVIRP